MAHIEYQGFPLVGASENIFTAHLKIDSTITDTIIKTIRDGGDKQGRETNVQASMTDWAMQEEPGFVELEEEISSIINYIPNILSSNYNGDDTLMVVDNIWGVLYKKNDYTNFHSHWPATWSGVFYLEIPNDYAGALVFPDLGHHIEPVIGQLVIFSGNTTHGVKTIQSNSERIAVSFNYLAKSRR